MKKKTSVFALLLAGAVCLSSCGRIIVKSDKDDEEEDTKKATETSASAVSDEVFEYTGVVEETFTEPTVRPYPGSTVNSEYTPGRIENGAFVNEWSNIKYTPEYGEKITATSLVDGVLCEDMETYYEHGGDYYEVYLWYRDLEGLDYSVVIENILTNFSESMFIDDNFSARIAGNLYEGYEMYAHDGSYGSTYLFREFNGYAEVIFVYIEEEMDIDPILERFTKYK